MTTINIGTGYKNIVGVEIDKPFKDIKEEDILKIVEEKLGSIVWSKESVSIHGWADVTNYKK